MIVGIELPDLSSVNRFMRDEIGVIEFPPVPFACQLRPEGVEDYWVALYTREEHQPADSMTRRERKRMLMIQKKYKI
jgi:hypothetical protein